MLSETPVTITICLGPLAVLTRPTIRAGNRLCIWRGWLSSLIFHSSFTFLTLAVVRICSSCCQAVRRGLPPSVSQSAVLSSKVSPSALRAAMHPQVIANSFVSFRIIELPPHSDLVSAANRRQTEKWRLLFFCTAFFCPAAKTTIETLSWKFRGLQPDQFQPELNAKHFQRARS